MTALSFGDPASIRARDAARTHGGHESTWRNRARPIIVAAIQANRGKPLAEIRRAISVAYPFGPRQYHPYQMWLKEVRAQIEVYLASLDAVKRIDALCPEEEVAA